MEINEYVIIIILVILSITFIGVMFGVIYSRLLLRHFKGQKVNIKARYQIESTTKKGIYKITLINDNLTDIKIKDFGIKYNNQEQTRFKQYISDLDLEDKEKILIEPEKSIDFSYTYDELKEIILQILDNRKKVKKIKVYAMTLGGHETIKSAKELRKNIIRVFKHELEMERLEENKIKAEKLSEKRKKQREIRDVKRKEKQAKRQKMKDNFKKSMKSWTSKVVRKKQEEVVSKEKESE